MAAYEMVLVATEDPRALLELVESYSGPPIDWEDLLAIDGEVSGVPRPQLQLMRASNVV